jgi:hypothetical protein
MRVRILQGKFTGVVTDVCQSEGENLLTTGFAERLPDLPAPVPSPAPVPEPTPVVAAPVVAAPVVEASGASLTDDDTHDAAIEAPEPEPVPARVRRRSPTVKKAAPATTRRKRR